MFTSFTNPPPEAQKVDPFMAERYAVLEAALQIAGASHPGVPSLVEPPSPYDAQLRLLIDSVPLE